MHECWAGTVSIRSEKGYHIIEFVRNNRRAAVCPRCSINSIQHLHTLDAEDRGQRSSYPLSLCVSLRVSIDMQVHVFTSKC